NGVGGVEVVLMRFDLHVGMVLGEMLRRRDDLWRAEIRNAINDLAREVRKFDRVRIDEAELTHSSAYKRHRGRHAEAANSDNQHAIIRQLSHSTKPMRRNPSSRACVPARSRFVMTRTRVFDSRLIFRDSPFMNPSGLSTSTLCGPVAAASTGQSLRRSG